jgi:hypothetical protein
MKGFPAIFLVAAMLAVVLGLPLGLYALLTRGRRRTMHEIRMSARGQGWQFRHRWILRGDPAEFDIRGRTQGGLQWIMTSRGTSGYDRGWSVRLKLRFPSLGGQVDFAILPREGGTSGSGGSTRFAAKPTLEAQTKLAKFSGTLARGAAFLRDAQELPSGLPAFDEAYEVLAIEKLIHQPLVDVSFARRFLEWPTDAVQPHSLIAWRGPFGLDVEVRLPGAPNWATVFYLVTLAEDFTTRVPAATPAAPRGFVDRIVASFLG